LCERLDAFAEELPVCPAKSVLLALAGAVASGSDRELMELVAVFSHRQIELIKTVMAAPDN
jgi:hypothetical protein